MTYGAPDDPTARKLAEYVERAEAVREADDAKWEALATGQDTEEAEASGFLAGQIAGLQAADAIMRGRYADAAGFLDLEIDP